uniref:HAT C-terminal dimerisation domain-containing protein n=1 Tax=Latimeria chalumnae TaxID=7897 RepID=H3AS25_LATCH
VGKYNSVLSRIKPLQPDVYDIGCVCHIANLVTQKAVKTLPLNVEDLLLNVYFHSEHSSKRKEQYKEFLDFTDTKPLKIVKHYATRWLSLEKCVIRLLHHWDALKSYFNSHNEIKHCAKMLNNTEMWLYFCFLEHLPLLNHFNTTFQTSESMIGYLLEEATILLRKIMGKFVTAQAIKDSQSLLKVPLHDKSLQHGDDIISENDDIPSQTLSSFFSHVRQFYEAATDKIMKMFPFQDATLKALRFLNPDSRDSIQTDAVIRLAEKLHVNDHDLRALEDEFLDYQLSSASELPDFECGSSLSDFWKAMANTKIKSRNSPRLHKVAVAALMIPHSNADTERLFSTLRKIYTDARSSLSSDAIHAILSTKVNNNTSCKDYRPEPNVLDAARKPCTTYNRRLQCSTQ